MNKLTIQNKAYYDMKTFMEMHDITRATVYNWVKSGKVTQKNIVKSAWFRLS